MYIKLRSGGFTLVETMVATGISSILLVVLASFSFYSARTCAAMGNYSDLETQSRQALDRITQQIRQAQCLTAFSSTKLTFRDADGGVLAFEFNPDARTLAREKDGASQILLEGCDYAKFEIFQRNPIAGTYDAYPTAAPDTCKLIQVSWVCSRSLLGVRANTESVQSAKIVIRKNI